MSYRIGSGYDVHRLVQGRPLVIGGVTIPFHKGLEGHSDADVLVHAACDAILGACGLGDIGTHFPDNDPVLKGVYSIELLGRCAEMMREKGYRLMNLDATIAAAAPRLVPHAKQMIANMAAALKAAPDQFNIKATTTEGLGFVGRGEGIAANCVVLIARKGN